MVPAGSGFSRRTSLLALASAMFAMVGAFTVVGSGLAVVLGLLAFVNISRKKERLTGAGLAAFGVAGGALFTGVTVFAVCSSNLLGLTGWLPGNLLSDVDTSGPLDVVLAEKGCAITRPSESWGRYPPGAVAEGLIGQLQGDADVILVQAARHSFVDVTAEDGRNGQTLE